MQEYKKIITIPIPIYESNLILEYNHSNEELEKIIKEDPDIIKEHRKQSFIDYIRELKQPYAGIYINDDFEHMIRISWTSNQKDLINSISHELLHFIHNLLKYRGLSLTQETEEAYCYLQGYLMGEIYENFIYDIIRN